MLLVGPGLAPVAAAPLLGASATASSAPDPATLLPGICQSGQQNEAVACLFENDFTGGFTVSSWTMVSGASDTITHGGGYPLCKGKSIQTFASYPCETLAWDIVPYTAAATNWHQPVPDVSAKVVDGCAVEEPTCTFRWSGPAAVPGEWLMVQPEVTFVKSGSYGGIIYQPDHFTIPIQYYGAGGPLGVDWTMPARTYPDNSDWSGNYGLPPKSWVDPSKWTVDLFLTDHGTKTCPADRTFDWAVDGNGYSEALSSDGCTATALVPKLGVYTVTAKEMRDGAPTGTEATNNHVVVRDWLIIGLGDSNGSGQGNPPYFANALCDRSVVSYQYQTALYIEKQDPRSSVTFVWDACSGARSDQLWKNSYEGQEPSGGVMLPPQIDQVNSVIGDRKPDAIIMSVGINDLYFGSIMAFCATYDITGTALTNHTCESAHVAPTTDAFGYTTAYSESPDFADATVAQRTAERLTVLPGRLALLNEQIATLDAAHIFATQYPDESTNEGGKLCNNTGPFPKLPAAVWGWLQQVGNGLNGVIAGTSSLGWVPVTGVAAAFIGHGYCSVDSYFDTPTRSQWEQGNRNGSFHANAAGAAITFALTRDKVCQALYGNPECDGLPPAPTS
jgi:hypothetical protein